MEIIVLSVAIIGAGLAFLSAGILSKEKKEEANKTRKREFMTQELRSIGAEKHDYEFEASKAKENYITETTQKLENEYETKKSEYEDNIEELKKQADDSPIQRKNKEQIDAYKSKILNLKKEYESKITEKEISINGLFHLRQRDKDIIDQTVIDNKKRGILGSPRNKKHIIQKISNTDEAKKIGVFSVGGWLDYCTTDTFDSMLDDYQKNIENELEKKEINKTKINCLLYSLTDLKISLESKTKEFKQSNDTNFKEEYITELLALGKKLNEDFIKLDELDTKYKEQQIAQTIKENFKSNEEKKQKREKKWEEKKKDTKLNQGASEIETMLK